MADVRQERISRRAHEIWEREGRREGSHRMHWERATAEIDAEDGRVERLEANLSEGEAAAPTPGTADNLYPSR
jgi:hypothetical protein